MTAHRRHHRVNVDLLKEIMAVQFALLETILYLNTHPDDRTVINLYNQYARRLMKLIHEYENNYGPLTTHHPESEKRWRWIDEPWPWQINY